MKNHSIKRNAILNVIRQICTVLFPLITFPYVSRVLLDENYGKVAFVTSVVSYFVLIAALGINNYAVREGAGYKDNKENMERFASQVYTINVLSTLFSCLLLFLTYLLWPKLHSYGCLVLILGISVCSATIGIEWLYTIYEDFAYITIRGIAIQIISLIAIFVFVREKEDYMKYAAITVFSTFAANIFNRVHSHKYINLHLTSDIEFRKHIQPMLILFCNALMISVYVNSDVTILGILKDDSEVGIYSVAVKIYTIVKTLLNAFTVVLIPRLSYYVRSNEIDKYQELSKKAIGIIIVILVPALVGLFMVSQDVVAFIAGEEYANAAFALRILCGAMGFALGAAFFVNGVLLPYKEDRIILFSTLISSLVNLFLNFIFIPLLSGTGAAITTLIAEGIVMCISIIYSKKHLKLRGFKKQIIEALCGGVGIVVLCIVVEQLSFNLYLRICVKIAISMLLYGGVLFFMKDELIGMIIPTFQNRFKKNKRI